MRKRCLKGGKTAEQSKDMSRISGKVQITVPKAITQRYGIRPGEEISSSPVMSSMLPTGALRLANPPTLELRLITALRSR